MTASFYLSLEDLAQGLGYSTIDQPRRLLHKHCTPGVDFIYECNGLPGRSKIYAAQSALKRIKHCTSIQPLRNNANLLSIPILSCPELGRDYQAVRARKVGKGYLAIVVFRHGTYQLPPIQRTASAAINHAKSKLPRPYRVIRKKKSA